MRSLRIGLFFCSLISVSIGATPNSQAQYAVKHVVGDVHTISRYAARSISHFFCLDEWMV